MSYIRSAVLSVQRGTVTITPGNNSGTTAITAPTVSALAVVEVVNSSLDSGGSGDGSAYVTLAGAVVTATRLWTSGTLTISFIVTEYKSRFVNNIQNFLISAFVASTVNTPVVAVVLAKSRLVSGGFATGDNVSGNAQNWNMSSTLSSNTNIATVSRQTAGVQQTVAVSVVEFK